MVSFSQPVLLAVSQIRGFERFLKSPLHTCILMDMHINRLPALIRAAHGEGKRVFLHADLLHGLAADEYGCEYICQQLRADGVISTKNRVLETARRNRSATILRLFLIDTKSLEKGVALIDSLRPDYVELLPGLALLRPETAFGPSRFDFYAEAAGEKWFVEVKGVTLERGGLTLFPDAPTLRGAKHLRELCGCIKEGYRACALFVVQMSGVRGFTPNFETDPEFTKALIEAGNSGVRLEAVDCFVTPESLSIRHKLPILLHFEKNLQQN